MGMPEWIEGYLTKRMHDKIKELLEDRDLFKEYERLIKGNETKLLACLAHVVDISPDNMREILSKMAKK